MSEKYINVVPKVWGTEKWVINDENHQYCHKKLEVNKGGVLSLHCHKNKLETFTLESGKVQLTLGDEVIDMLPGDSKTVIPGTYHSFAGYHFSVITEVSTFHSDDDSYRLWESHVKPEILAFDIDGTLEGSDTDPGIITREHIGDREFVIVSSRSRKRSQEICDRMGIKPLKIYCCRILSRAEELNRVDRDFPLRVTTYIGDTITDKDEALLAGWEFMFPDQFISLNSSEKLESIKL